MKNKLINAVVTAGIAVLLIAAASKTGANGVPGAKNAGAAMLIVAVR